MKISELFDDLTEQVCYTDFMTEFPDAFLTAAFCMLHTDSKKGDSLQLDFFCPSTQRMSSFTYPFTTVKRHDDLIASAESLDVSTITVELDSLSDRMKELFSVEFETLICVLQNGSWNLTGMNGLTLKRCKIDAVTGEVHKGKDIALQDMVTFRR